MSEHIKQPDDEMFDACIIHHPEKWNEHLWENLFRSSEWFKGNPQRAGMFMDNLVRGMKWSLKETQKIDKDFTMPEIFLVQGFRDVGPYDASAVSQIDGNIIVDTNVLGQQTLELTSDEVEAWDKNGNLMVKGSIQEFYFLTGVEEVDHARFNKMNPHLRDIVRLRPGVVSTEEYHAQQHEYEALQKKIIAAEEVGIHPVMFEILKNKLKAVELLRAGAKEDHESQKKPARK